jgi:hypothetical protein
LPSGNARKAARHFRWTEVKRQSWRRFFATTDANGFACVKKETQGLLFYAGNNHHFAW